jgi:lambda repressor-like predicted transcriptional regulator
MAMNRVDWFRVLADLRANGWSETNLSTQIQIARSTINSWKSGSEPRHADGEILVAFWCECSGKPRESLPLAARESSAARTR